MKHTHPASGSRFRLFLVTLLGLAIFWFAPAARAANDRDTVFAWAELTYPQLFAPAPATDQTLDDYTYRAYLGTGSYLASKGNHLYYLGPASNNTIIDLGVLADYLPQANASCARTLSGRAAKGPLQGAGINAYTVNADGSKGSLLASGSTASDNSGNFTLRLPCSATANGSRVLLESSGGSYQSPFNGKTVRSTYALRSLVGADESTVALTPLSDLAANRALRLFQSGKNLADASLQADREVQALFGLSIRPAVLPPSFRSADLASNTDAYTAGLYLSSLDAFAHRIEPQNPESAYALLSSDFSDGQLDGKNGNGSIDYGKLGQLGAQGLRSALFADTKTTVTAVLSGTSPSSLNNWITNNPATAASTGIMPTLPGYSCGQGYVLITGPSANQTCWDGTMDSNGQPLIGLYAVCAANGKKVADVSLCPKGGGYSCGSGYSLTSDSRGTPTCWDGTHTADGTPLIGSYVICAADGSKVATANQCPASGLINQRANSTTIAMYTANPVNALQNSTQIALYQAPPVTTYQAPTVVPVPSAQLVSIHAADSSASIPDYVSSGGLNQAQIDAYATMNKLIFNANSYYFAYTSF